MMRGTVWTELRSWQCGVNTELDMRGRYVMRHWSCVRIGAFNSDWCSAPPASRTSGAACQQVTARGAKSALRC